MDYDGQDYLKKNQPDYLLILPWNIADEIKSQLSFLNKKKTTYNERKKLGIGII